MSKRGGASARRLGVVVTGVLAVLAPGSAAAADVGPHAVGLRAGISVNPDQFHAGVHADLGDDPRFWFRPGFEVGLGNGVRIGAFNADVLVGWGKKKTWRPYAGAGPGLNLIDVTRGIGEAQGVETDVVLNAVAGVATGGSGRAARPGRGRYFLEARFGIGDTPDLKLTAGISF